MQSLNQLHIHRCSIDRLASFRPTANRRWSRWFVTIAWGRKSGWSASILWHTADSHRSQTYHRMTDVSYVSAALPVRNLKGGNPWCLADPKVMLCCDATLHTVPTHCLHIIRYILPVSGHTPFTLRTALICGSNEMLIPHRFWSIST